MPKTARINCAAGMISPADPARSIFSALQKISFIVNWGHVIRIPCQMNSEILTSNKCLLCVSFQNWRFIIRSSFVQWPASFSREATICHSTFHHPFFVCGFFWYSTKIINFIEQKLFNSSEWNFTFNPRSESDLFYVHLNLVDNEAINKKYGFISYAQNLNLSVFLLNNFYFRSK